MPHVATEVITAALRLTGGCKAQAARILRISTRTIFDRLQQCPAAWPRDVPPSPIGKQRGGPATFPKKHPDAVVTAALREHRGNVSAAARSLGQWPKTLWSRVRRNPSLWPEGFEALKAGGMPGSMRR